MPKPHTIKPGPGAHHTTQIKLLPKGKPKVINAENLVLGRLASVVAKRLLHGDEIIVVNAEKALITGDPQSIVEEYKHKHGRGTNRKGPYFPRMPDRIVKRTVRGMLPYQRGNGRAAFRRLRVYIGTPDDVKGPAETIETATTRAHRTITVGDVAKGMGAKF